MIRNVASSTLLVLVVIVAGCNRSTTHSSTAIILVLSSPWGVGIDQNSAHPIDRDLNQHADLIQSERVLMLAFDQFCKKHPTNQSDAFADFVKHLKVEIVSSSSILKVSFFDPDPEVAAAGVHAIVYSYENIVEETSSDEIRRILNSLEARQTVLSNRLARLRDELRTLAAHWGDIDLEALHAEHVKQLAQLEFQVIEAEVEFDSAHKTATQPTTENVKTADEMRELAARTERLRETCHRLQARVDELAQGMGEIGQKKVEAERLRAQLDEIEKRFDAIEDRAAAGGSIRILNRGDEAITTQPSAN